MRYLIITKDSQPFYTQWYEYENHYHNKIEMIFDTVNLQHTFDGINWVDTILDHL